MKSTVLVSLEKQAILYIADDNDHQLKSFRGKCQYLLKSVYICIYISIPITTSVSISSISIPVCRHNSKHRKSELSKYVLNHL